MIESIMTRAKLPLRLFKGFVTSMVIRKPPRIPIITRPNSSIHVSIITYMTVFVTNLPNSSEHRKLNIAKI